MPNALFSLYDKTTGGPEFATKLSKLGWNIYSSGGTAKAIAALGTPVTDVAELVGGGAILGHRVVTLSREVHSGLLATESDCDIAELEALGLPRIHLVCIGVYPLAEAVSDPNATRESVIEKTDIGGPTMLSSAAKGQRIAVCDPKDYTSVYEWISSGQPDKENFIGALAAKADAMVSEYRLLSARFHSDKEYDGWIGKRHTPCCYGENRWQSPADLYEDGVIKHSSDPLAITNFEQVCGSAPSYNNFCDIDRVLQTITHIAAAWDFNYDEVPCIAVAVKHGNACGSAVGSNGWDAIYGTLRGDRRALMGGIIITNFAINEMLAIHLLTSFEPKGKRRLIDSVVCPAVTTEAIDALKRFKGKCRVFTNPALAGINRNSLDVAPLRRPVRGGMLIQPNYTFVLNLQNELLQKLGPAATLSEEMDMLLAWAIGSTSTSNTITLVKNGELIGNGVGQQDRVGACKLAVKRAKEAGHQTNGASAYSDSFFPFADGPEVLRKAGVRAILSSSDSKNDNLTIEYCVDRKVSLYLIPDSVGRGFYGN